MKRILTAMLCLAMTSGCASFPKSLGDFTSLPGGSMSWLWDKVTRASNDEPEEGEEVVGESPSIEDQISAAKGDKIAWLHGGGEVASWEIVERLQIRFSGKSIVYDQELSGTAGKRYIHEAWLTGNPWIFVKKDGVWYAATWEWFRSGQQSKAAGNLNGDHIKVSPLMEFEPVSGTEYGFMESCLARDGTRNCEKRTNIVLVTWP